MDSPTIIHQGKGLALGLYRNAGWAAVSFWNTPPDVLRMPQIRRTVARFTAGLLRQIQAMLRVWQLVNVTTEVEANVLSGYGAVIRTEHTSRLGVGPPIIPVDEYRRKLRLSVGTTGRFFYTHCGAG